MWDISSRQSIGTQRDGLDFPQKRKHLKIIMEPLILVKQAQNIVQMKSFKFISISIAMTVSWKYSSRALIKQGIFQQRNGVLSTFFFPE